MPRWITGQPHRVACAIPLSAGSFYRRSRSSPHHCFAHCVRHQTKWAKHPARSSYAYATTRSRAQQRACHAQAVLGRAWRDPLLRPLPLAGAVLRGLPGDRPRLLHFKMRNSVHRSDRCEQPNNQLTPAPTAYPTSPRRRKRRINVDSSWQYLESTSSSKASDHKTIPQQPNQQTQQAEHRQDSAAARPS